MRVWVKEELYNMILLPRDLVEPQAAQEVDNVLASVVLRASVRGQAHEDDRHAGEEAHEGASGLCGFDGVACDLGRDVDDGEGDALLDDDGSLDGHVCAPFGCVCCAGHDAPAIRQARSSIFRPL